MNIREEFDARQAEALAIYEKAETEGRSITAEENKLITENFARCKEISEQIKGGNSFKSLSVSENDKAILNLVSSSPKKEFKKMEKENIETSTLEGLKHFGRGQLRSDADYQKFALTSGGNGGILMPRNIPGFLPLRQTGNAFRKGFAALGRSTFVTSIMENVDLPVLDDTGLLANNDQEGATTGANQDTDHDTQIEMPLVEYHSRAQWVSQKVANAYDFDVSQYLIPLALNRIERRENQDWTAAVVAVGAGNVGVTAASATAVTLAELIRFDESFPAAYDETGIFIMCSKAARQAIRLLADTTTRPFFSIDNNIEKLFGKPLIVNPNLGAMTTGQTVLMAVSVDGSIIRDCTHNEVVRYEKIPQHPAQVGYEAFGWSAFGFVNEATRRLVLA